LYISVAPLQMAWELTINKQLWWWRGNNDAAINSKKIN
jgi:hypothetical protein